MKILFISRAYPPVVGGIENQNYELSIWLSKIAEVKIIANKFGKIFLPIFLPYSFFRALFSIRKYDAILLGDGVLSCVGHKLKFFTKKPVICVVHGLDLTYSLWIYQKLWVGFFLKKMDKLIAVGNETVRIGIKKEISENKFVFIPNGVDAEKHWGNYSREDLEKVIGEKLNGRKIILTSGRLAKRKGVAWFIRHVMPKLPENIAYIIAGDGPDKENIQKAILENNLSKRVKMLGYISDEKRNILFNTADIFIQPNIKIPNDVEGFGISVIEAGSCKLPVVASKLEGLQDAIKDGENGFLVDSGNAEAWIQKIMELLNDDNFRKEFGEKARKYIIENYSWEKIANIYLEEIEKVIKE